MSTHTAMVIEGHEFLIPTEPPAPIEVEDLPPADIDACERCDGLGVMVVGHDQADRPLDEPCTWCDGTGDRRAAA